MTAINIGKKIEALREKIRYHDYLYYCSSQPKISDKEYDDLMCCLKELEDRNPAYKSDTSPTVRLSSVISRDFKTVKHLQKMLSLDNTYSIEELREWEERLQRILGLDKKIEYVAEHKIDGVSVSVTYIKGKLSIGATRGDGETGEDITQNIKTIRSIPLVLRGEAVPELIEARGEVYMDKNDFEALNKERETQGNVLFANPRNAASGSLKLLDTNIVAKRKLSFFCHSLGEYKGLKIQSQWEFLEMLRKWGLRSNPYSKLCKNLDEVISYCNQWQGKREKVTYDMDGIVIKVNSLFYQKELGFTLKSPRWAAAYKFPARQAMTKVLRITVNVGRTGVLTPVAELKAVECAGVIIKHATLHNFDEIKRLNIKEGDRVLIERSGDVIPKIVKVIEDKEGDKFMPPSFCPECSGKIVKEKEEDVAYRCINPSCPAQIERGLEHFASRKAMDIQGMGEAVVKQLIRLKLVNNFADIYFLNAEDLLKLELFKEKKVKNLLSAVEKSKKQPLSRLIYGLGIRHVGEKAAFVLAGRFKAMDNLMAAKLDELDRIYEIGLVMAKSIVDYFTLGQTKELIEGLKKAGVNFKEEGLQFRASMLIGKHIVFTGELKGFSRLEAEGHARQIGLDVSSNVSKNTDFVVVGDNSGSKYDKARKLGVKIINEKEFMEMIK
ncbi:MAG: NAD-dependent DNA ligase LigA [Candidatus Omnitrophota bacterium]|nr:NAD-dependent DNA ligase LigA [Candidatus Omnitrophota bacterium]